VGPKPHLQIEKWLIGENPGVGGNAAFYVQYQNQGEANAEEVTISDTMEGMTYIRDSSGVTPTLEGDNWVWNFGTVEPGDWIGFVVFTEVIASEGEPVRNTAFISTSSLYDEGDPSEKTSTWEGTVAANDTHLNVGKDTWTENPAPGEDFIYHINVCNNGSTGSSTVTLVDTLPDATNFVSWWRGDPGWQFVNQTGQTLELEHTCISANSCSEVYIQVALDSEVQPGEQLINQVEISASNDMETDDNTAEVQHQVGEAYVDIGVDQSFHGGSLVPGGYYRYGVHFNNEGNVAVSAPVELVVTLPEGTNFAGWDTWGYIQVADPIVVDNEVTWQLVGDIIPGYYGTVEVWVDIESETTPGTVLEHLAEIEIQPGEENTENNVSILNEMINNHGPNLRIHKYGGVQGDDFHRLWYQLYVENIGDETVTDVVVSDYFAEGLELEGDLSVNFSEWWDRNLYSDHFDVMLEKLEPGWTMQIDYNMVIPGEDPVEPGLFFENIAEVYPVEEDVNPEDNTVSYMMATGPDMYVNKDLAEGEFLPGEQVTYLLQFGNKHHENAWWWEMAGIAILTDILPDGMSFVSAEMHWCEEMEWCEATPSITGDGQILTWDLYPLGGDQWNEIRLTVEISSDIEGGIELSNELTISSDNSEADVDPYMENNTDTYAETVGFKYFLPLLKN